MIVRTLASLGLACGITSASFAQSENHYVSGTYTLVRRISGQLVCPSQWTFHHDGTLNIQAGSLVINSTYRVEANGKSIPQLVTRAVRNNGQFNSCFSSVSSKEVRFYLIRLRGGALGLCNVKFASDKPAVFNERYCSRLERDPTEGG